MRAVLQAILMLPCLPYTLPSQPLAAAPQLLREGKLEEALAAYLQALAASPKSAQANNGAGVVLDLLGRSPEARPYFLQAIKSAASPAEKAQAQRALAVSYAFAHDCKGAEKADRWAYDFFLGTSDFYNAGEVANELGRICLESGDGNTAYTWYERGHEAGLQQPDLPPDRQDLWDFRWAHARARMAVRRGKGEEARKYVNLAQTILKKGRIPTQQPYFSYLTGYVAFYAGDYQTAVNDLQAMDPPDAFIQCLIAQSYEKLGDGAKARDYYRKAALATAHSVPAAYGRTLARTKL